MRTETGYRSKIRVFGGVLIWLVLQSGLVQVMGAQEVPSPRSIAQVGESPAAELKEEAGGSGPGARLYRIGPGDVLQIEVFEVPELGRKLRVRGDGTISLPLLGSVAVGGRSLQEAEEKIARLLAERRLVVDPQVSIFVEEYVSQGVAVLGAVVRSGIYQIAGGGSLLEVLGAAGGLTSEAAGRILIQRTAPDVGDRTYAVDGDRLLRQGDPSLNVAVRPGDRILVPALRRMQTFVSGAVARQGTVEFADNDGLTLLQAVIAAGGVSSKGDEKTVSVLRSGPDGQRQTLLFNLLQIKRGQSEDPLLAANDIVIVGE